jgi:amino acid transporter
MGQAVEVTPSNGTPQQLSRVLGLWDVVFFGMMIVSPIAPVPLFGLTEKLSHGFSATCILLSMGAMTITAISYGRMAAIYPSAGSAYTYITRGLNAHAGFMVGWALLLDYLDQPILNTIVCALTIQRLLPHIPYIVLAAACVWLMTYLNLRNVRVTARANEAMLAAITVVIGIFIVLAFRFIFKAHGIHGFISAQPFYDPERFELQAVATGTAFAALAYIGFDSVTLLAEEVKNPKRNIMLAGVMVAVFTGFFAGLQCYLAQLVWPDYRSYPHMETAFIDVARRVGHTPLFEALAVVMVINSIGIGVTGQLGAARLLFSMGRDKVLPRRPFGILGRTKVPRANVLIIGVLAFIFSQIFSFELAGEMLNFGAFLAFMGVNVACFAQFYLHVPAGQKRHPMKDALLPLGGFFFCLWIWTNLARPSFIRGMIWLGVGLLYAAIKTRGFRGRALTMDFRDV